MVTDPNSVPKFRGAELVLVDIDLQVLEAVEGIGSQEIESRIRNYHK